MKISYNFFCEIWGLVWRHNRGKILIFRQIWYFGLVESKNQCKAVLFWHFVIYDEKFVDFDLYSEFDDIIGGFSFLDQIIWKTFSSKVTFMCTLSRAYRKHLFIYSGAPSPPWGFYNLVFLLTLTPKSIEPWVSSSRKPDPVTSRGLFMMSYG